MSAAVSGPRRVDTSARTRIETTSALDRRPIPARDAGWAHALAALVAARGVSADAVSIAGLVAALLAATAEAGAAAFPGAARFLLPGAALLILGRLLANMLDGMVAGLRGGSRLGPLYNEIPDRIADVAILGAAGLLATPGGIALGLGAALAALATAYVRSCALIAGVPQPFMGPGAKPQRMFVLAAAFAIAAVAVPVRGGVVATALGVITAGAAITCVRRLAFIARSVS